MDFNLIKNLANSNSLYIFKVLLAAFLAFSIALILNTPDPRTALFAVFIVMHQKNGFVISKSFYRIIGTIIGAVVSLILMAFFAQDEFWFLICFAIWIGICNGASVKYRNFQSYGFLLAGYTICIIALPVIESPTDVFDIAISRFFEVLLGIMCATFVSEIIFPNNLSTVLLKSEKDRYTATIKQILDFKSSIQNKQSMANFANIAISMHAFKTNSSFETLTNKKERLLYEHLNLEYMNLQTSLHSFASCFLNAKQENSTFTDEIFLHYQQFANIANDILISNYGNLGAKIDELSKIYSDFNNKTDTKNEINLVLAMLFGRIVLEFKLYSNTLKSLLEIKNNTGVQMPDIEIKFKTHADSLLVGIAFLRGVVVFFLAVVFWILSGWQFALQTIMLAVISTLLFGALPNPVGVAKKFTVGMVLAFVIAYFWDFYIAIYATDLISLFILLSPVLAFAAWLTTKPQYVVMSLGFTFMFMYSSAVDPYFKIEPAQFFDIGISSLIGMVFTIIGVLLVNFYSNSLTYKRVIKALNEQIMQICTKAAPHQRAIVESKSRDMIWQFSTHGQIDSNDGQNIYDWLLYTLEIARATIEIQNSLQILQIKEHIVATKNILTDIKSLFEEFSSKNLESFYAAIVNFNKNIYGASFANEQLALIAISKELKLIKVLSIAQKRERI